MTDLIATVQDQGIDSDLVVLYDLEYANNTFAHFCEQLDTDLTSLQFRNTAGTIKTYTALPIMAEGFSVSSDGAYSRPTLTIANALSTFQDAIGSDTDYEDLIGKRITKRTTLKKYLVGETGDTTPPVEFPKIVYIIDRLVSKNLVSVTFELAAPYDLAGVKLPRRQVIGGACPWKYTGADPTYAEAQKEGGCVWKRDSTAFVSGATRSVYVSENDEYIVDISDLENASLVTTSSSSFNKNSYYYTPHYQDKITTDGLVKQVMVKQYWHCVTRKETTKTKPSTNSTEWKRIRAYKTYSATAEYEGFRNTDFNEYVKYGTTVWKVYKKSVVGVTPGENASWTRGDVCGKNLRSCEMRFKAKLNDGKLGYNTASNSGSTALPFGGFPGARVRR